MRRHPVTADRHIHTTLSDGGSSPLDVLKGAARVGLKEIAITDHDCIDAHRGELGKAVAAQGDNVGIKVITGVEIDCDLGEHDVEVLGYAFDPDQDELVDRLALVQKQRLERYRFYSEGLVRIGSLQAGFDTLPEGSRVPMKVHLYRAALSSGQDFPRGYLEFKASLRGLGTPPPLQRPTVREAVELIRRAGGFTILAHPLYYLDDVGLGPLLQAGAEAGCVGLELAYPYRFGSKALPEEKVQNGLGELIGLLHGSHRGLGLVEMSRGTDVHKTEEWAERLEELELVEDELFDLEHPKPMVSAPDLDGGLAP